MGFSDFVPGLQLVILWDLLDRHPIGALTCWILIQQIPLLGKKSCLSQSRTVQTGPDLLDVAGRRILQASAHVVRFPLECLFLKAIRDDWTTCGRATFFVPLDVSPVTFSIIRPLQPHSRVIDTQHNAESKLAERALLNGIDTWANLPNKHALNSSMALLNLNPTSPGHRMITEFDHPGREAGRCRAQVQTHPSGASNIPTGGLLAGLAFFYGPLIGTGTLSMCFRKMAVFRPCKCAACMPHTIRNMHVSGFIFVVQSRHSVCF